jgi:nudix-type nucleoside diphosphatase (YffH/AdpP family)
MKVQILDRQTTHSGYLTIERLHLRLGDGATIRREVERHGNGAAVLPYNAEQRRALVVRQFRTPVFDACGDEDLEEACAGMVTGEDAEAAARREAYEELGVVLNEMEFVGQVWPSPGVSSERQSLFLAPYSAADRTGKGGGVASENELITVCERSLAELASDADHGRIADAKLLTLVLALRLRHPELYR